MRMIALLLLLLPLGSLAQVVELSAGSSSLYQASGGAGTVYWPRLQLEFGGGAIGDLPVVNLAARFPFHGWDVAVGENSFSASVGNTGLFINSLGVTLHKNDLTLFTGDVQPLLGSSFFRGSRLGLRGGGGLAYQHRFKDGWQISSLAVAAGKKLSLLQDVDYHRGPNFEVGGSGGWLENKPLAQARMSYRFDGHVAISGNYLRTNGLTFGAVMGTAGLGPVTVYATGLFGSQAGATYGANLRFGFLEAGSSYLQLRENGSLGFNLGERLGRHLTLRQYASRSGGRWNLAFGGSFTTNRFSVNVEQQTFLAPLGNAPLQRSLVAMLHFQLPWHSVSVNIASGVDPAGKVRWGVDGTTFIGEGLGGSNQTPCCCCDGRFIIRGKVWDPDDHPVAGAAVQVGKSVVFSGPDGTFWVRVKRAKPLPLEVELDQFTAPGDWQVVSCPAMAAPGESVQVIVRRAK